MISYLAINGLIGLLTLAIFRFLKASIKLRYYFALFALFVWFMPYAWLNQWMSTSISKETTWIIPNIDFTTTQNEIAKASESALSLDVMSLFYILFAVGGFLFIYRLIKLLHWQKSLTQNHEFQLLEHDFNSVYAPVRITRKIQSALITGYKKPVIWISTRIAKSQHLELVLIHESQHIASKDNWKLLFLELIRSLFWWNPIVIRLVNEVKFLIEAQCDQKACASFGRLNYLNGLAKLMLEQPRIQYASFVSTISQKQSTNMKRIAYIKENNPMTNLTKSIYSLASLLFILLILSPIFESRAIATETHQSSSPVNLNEKITLNFKEIPLNAFATIMGQFLSVESIEVSPSITKHPVDISVESMPAAEVFALIEKEINVRFELNDNQLTVTELSPGIKSNPIQSRKAPTDKNQGALVNFKVVTTNLNKNTPVNATFAVWTEFGKQAFIKLDDEWQIALTPERIKDQIKLSFIVIENTQNPEMDIVASPTIITNFNEEATVSFINDQLGEKLELFVTASKTPKPQQS